MSIRERLLRLLKKREAGEPARGAVVEIGAVWLYEGPRALQILENAGIDAQGVESSDVASDAPTTRLRIFVRQADAARARAALERNERWLRGT